MIKKREKRIILRDIIDAATIIVEDLKTNTVPKSDKSSSAWMSMIYKAIDPDMQNGGDSPVYHAGISIRLERVKQPNQSYFYEVHTLITLPNDKCCESALALPDHQKQKVKQAIREIYRIAADKWSAFGIQTYVRQGLTNRYE